MSLRFCSVCLALVLGGAATDMLAATNVVQLTQIGNPTWRPVDFHFFTAPVGTVDDEFGTFWDTVGRVLLPPNHTFNPYTGVGPGTAHAGPYETEIADGLKAVGFRQGSAFSAGEFTASNAVFFCWMNVPATNAPVGSSPDFASGPIIANGILPLHQTGLTTRNGATFDTNWTGDTVTLAMIVPPIVVDGYSHCFNFNAETASFGPTNTPAIGHYQHNFSIVDTNGSGWNITASFEVSDQDLAVTGIVAPKVVHLSATKTSQTSRVTILIQNRSPHDVVITNLSDVVTLQVLSLTNICPNLTPVLLTSAPQVTVKRKAKLPVIFTVTYSKDCVPDPAKSLTGVPHFDYRYVARLNYASDIHPDDDACPRAPAGPDPNPDGKIIDRGCGGKTSTGVLGADVLTDVVVK